MGRILDAVSGFFEADEWRTSELQGPTEGLVTGFRGDNGNWTCMAVAIEEHDQMLFYSVCPVTAPEENRSTIGEFLHRANKGLHVGNFELDYNDGEIRFKTSVDVEGTELPAPHFHGAPAASGQAEPRASAHQLPCSRSLNRFRPPPSRCSRTARAQGGCPRCCRSTS